MVLLLSGEPSLRSWRYGDNTGYDNTHRVTIKHGAVN
jgi:hypothetical protein